mmetsp:Transcript_16186/g.22477  ORF Transcript_16186/g.22477 Transcript_16186/m.22477 type:complete len:206 (+) Transcript_16186:103-720(+)
MQDPNHSAHNSAQPVPPTYVEASAQPSYYPNAQPGYAYPAQPYPQSGYPQPGQYPPGEYPPQGYPQGQPQPYPQGQPVVYPYPVAAQPVTYVAQTGTVVGTTTTPVATTTTYTTTVQRTRPEGEEDIIPALIIFFVGWFGICCVWLGGFAYYKSKNPTARMLAWASLAMYGVSALCALIWIIWAIVAAASYSGCDSSSSYGSSSC